MERRLDGYRQAAAVLVLTSAVLGLPRCAPKAPRGELEAVSPPPDLQQLDPAVQEQFAELRRALESPAARAEGETEGAAWGAMGRWYHVYRYPDSAARCYENARRLSPEEPRWPYHLGSLAQDAGELSRAEALYTEASLRDPDALEPPLKLAELALNRGELERAGELYRRVLTQAPEDPWALLGSARVSLLGGDAAAAVPVLQRLLAQQPEMTPARYALGLAWRRLGQEERAALELARVPHESVDNVAVLVGPWHLELERFDQGSQRLTVRGARAFRRGEYVRSAVLLGRAVAADPSGAAQRVNYARALRQLGDRAEAREQLDAALAIAPSGSSLAASALLERGRLLLDEQRLEEAAARFEDALEIDPELVPARVELGRLRHRQGRLSASLEQYRALRDGFSGVEGAALWHAAILTLLDRRDEALVALDEDRRRVDDDRPLQLLQARLLATAPGGGGGSSDVDRARELVTGAAAAAPDVFFAETRAMVMAAAGRFPQAVAWQRSAVGALSAKGARIPAQIARRRLVLYERGDACRRPWELTERLVVLPVAAPEEAR